MDDLAPDLVVTAEGPVRLIELNRPEQLNAASEALHTALAGVWDRLADVAVRSLSMFRRDAETIPLGRKKAGAASVGGCRTG